MRPLAGSTPDPQQRYALLYYYIPKTSKLGNPSGLLRRWGIRVDLSVWIVPMKNLPLIPMKEWIDKGAVADVVEFGEHEREKCLSIARRTLQNDVEKMRLTVEKSVAKVRRRFDSLRSIPVGTPERDEAQKSAEHFAYLTLYRAKAIADSAEECALHFDLTGDVAPLVDALRRTIKAKSALYFSLGEDVRKNAPLSEVS